MQWNSNNLIKKHFYNWVGLCIKWAGLCPLGPSAGYAPVSVTYIIVISVFVSSVLWLSEQKS